MSPTDSPTLYATLKSCEEKLNKFYDCSTTESEYYYFSTGKSSIPNCAALLTQLSVLDPCFGDCIFKNQKNSDYFEPMWVKECKESLIKHMDIMSLPSPDESNPTSSATPAGGTCMGTFDSLMDLEILGDCSTSMAETETAEEELVRYLHTAGFDMKQDPLLWWKKNAPLYPHALPMMFQQFQVSL